MGIRRFTCLAGLYDKFTKQAPDSRALVLFTNQQDIKEAVRDFIIYPCEFLLAWKLS